MTRIDGTTIAKIATATAPFIVFALIQVALGGQPGAGRIAENEQAPARFQAGGRASTDERQGTVQGLPADIRHRLRRSMAPVTAI
ncbi:MAG: hypothetical protein KIT20_15745 [Alphaproteobacteria bacterium]|nr:hypothetical protein [Alphaproteobacteria bacterium]